MPYRTIQHRTEPNNAQLYQTEQSRAMPKYELFLTLPYQTGQYLTGQYTTPPNLKYELCHTLPYHTTPNRAVLNRALIMNCDNFIRALPNPAKPDKTEPYHTTPYPTMIMKLFPYSTAPNLTGQYPTQPKL